MFIRLIACLFAFFIWNRAILESHTCSSTKETTNIYSKTFPLDYSIHDSGGWGRVFGVYYQRVGSKGPLLGEVPHHRKKLL
jgi:hypothetical protein